MAQLVGVQEQCNKSKLNLKRRQLPVTVDDNKIMIMQLSDTCEECAQVSIENRGKKKGKSWLEDVFVRQYNSLTTDEAAAALMVETKTFLNRLAQVVGCVGCRRSVEQLFNQLKYSGHPALDPLCVNKNGVLTIMKYSFQPKILGSLFSEHSAPLNDMLDNIPKLKKSGRCVLHSMEGVRCRPGSQSWLDMWDTMAPECRETITLINSEQLLITLDNYLRKHRFCHDCKNKVHRAYDILVGIANFDHSKEKGFVESLYAGIKKCSTNYIHVNSETDFIMQLITRAEPEMQGRRERHAKTLEIAQEEVLTCLGLFLYERFQRIHAKMKEEEQTWYILFHVGLDALRRNFELAIEEKQGFSKFEVLCEELQKQELRERAKKEKRKKRKNKKKKIEMKENYVSDDDDQSCHECESNRSSPLQINSSAVSNNYRSISKQKNSSFQESNNLDSGNSKWREQGNKTAPRKGYDDRKTKHHDKGAQHSIAENFISQNGHQQPSLCNCLNNYHSPSKQHLECSESIDSLTSRCSQCSKDGGYCSAQCSTGSSRESSDIACGEGFCCHFDDLEHTHVDPLIVSQRETILSGSSIETLNTKTFPFTLSLEKMLDDSSCEADEIPEAEVQEWHARLGAVRQKRAELRQTLRQRFQQLCYRKSHVIRHDEA